MITGSRAMNAKKMVGQTTDNLEWRSKGNDLAIRMKGGGIAIDDVMMQLVPEKQKKTNTSANQIKRNLLIFSERRVRMLMIAEISKPVNGIMPTISTGR